MSRPITRRSALRGSVAASLGLMAGVASADAVPVLSANDLRLVELADAYEALDRRCNEHTAAHRHDLTNAADAEFDVLTSGFGPAGGGVRRHAGRYSRGRHCQGEAVPVPDRSGVCRQRARPQRRRRPVPSARGRGRCHEPPRRSHRRSAPSRSLTPFWPAAGPCRSSTTATLRTYGGARSPWSTRPTAS